MNKYLNYSFAIIRRMLVPPHSIEDVEDIVSDVFEAVWKNCQNISGNDKRVKSYIGAISRNRAINFLNLKSSHDINSEDMVFIDNTDVEKEVIEKTLKKAVRDEVDKLPEQEKEIIIRHYFYYQSISQISMEMEIPENTVKSKLFRSRKILNSRLKEVVENEI